MRFSVSGLISTVIAAALFIGMLSLLKGKTLQITSSDPDIKFSFVKAYQPIEPKPPRETVLPEPKKVVQPPAAPPLPTTSNNKSSIDLPENFGTAAKDLNIIKGISIPMMGTGTGYDQGANGGLKTGIAPMYPPAALMSKTEGWVEVLITVNEFGQVADVEVLNAEPRRVFNAAATKAVRKWRFFPKEVDGQAISYQVTQTIEFKIDQQ